jgi:molybdate/tungstate transport system ATP-binding protein
VIVVRNLVVRAGSFALNGITFQISTGAYSVLMGRTGSGKTTLLEALCGLRRAHSGTIEIMGLDVTKFKPAERGIGYVPQDRALFGTMTVREHLGFALRLRKWEPAAIQRRVHELADLLSISSLLHRKPPGLSGGEAQRVALGRALSFKPRVLIMDEPLSALDDETRQEMCALLKTVREQAPVTTLHVTHNRAEAELLGDKILSIVQGGIVEKSVGVSSALRHVAGAPYRRDVCSAEEQR